MLFRSCVCVCVCAGVCVCVCVCVCALYVPVCVCVVLLCLVSEAWQRGRGGCTVHEGDLRGGTEGMSAARLSPVHHPPTGRRLRGAPGRLRLEPESLDTGHSTGPAGREEGREGGWVGGWVRGRDSVCVLVGMGGAGVS